MQPDYAERIARLELQVSFLLRHLGLKEAKVAVEGMARDLGVR
jgi:hypothetical protein